MAKQKNTRPPLKLQTMSVHDLNLSAANNYRQQATVPLGSETHGGEDVIAYARGPMAHLFQGTHEQTYIAHMIRYVKLLNVLLEKNRTAEASTLFPRVALQ